MARLTFIFPNNPDWNQIVYVFIVKDFKGTPTESEEMQPKWFKIEDIPYHLMWADDKYWLPHVLNGKKLKAKFILDENGELIRKNVRFTI